MKIDQVKTAVREAVANRGTDDEVADALDKLIDYFDERITKIEKATGFMGVSGH